MELTLIQKKLLKLLAINCRFSNKDLAASIGVSEDTVQYQIEKLVHQEKVGSFMAVFDCRMAGLQYHTLFVRCKRPMANFANIAVLPQVTFIGRSLGKYDAMFILLCRDDKEVMATVARIQEVLGEQLAYYALTRDPYEHKWSNVLPLIDVSVPIPKNQKNPVYALRHANYFGRENAQTIKLDALDYSIIRMLLKDARASYLSISGAVGVTHETVRQRIHRYVEKGFLVHTGLFINFSKLGYFAHYILLKIQHFDQPKFRHFVESKNYIFYAGIKYGSYEGIIYTVARDPSEFALQVREIREQLGEYLHDLELLYYEETEKNQQFPVELFDRHSPRVANNL